VRGVCDGWIGMLLGWRFGAFTRSGVGPASELMTHPEVPTGCGTPLRLPRRTSFDELAD
jgi:hypothetical protein